MESIGKFEFNKKDLIGHGAFAVVFKGRHKEKRDFEVAVKCINKKNLSKSQSLLGKEIKILKELKHENIVGLLDYQERGGCVYLVMEYCNGGDLAEYLHSKGTLSEDTIRGFLQQIAQAMKVLQSKGILHRDLKPQNILLCHPEGRRSNPNNTCIKIADFGFARHLQTNTMAATLCGSPMYMAPEVITSQSYDAKADLWSIGTIVFQCLTGKAPFHASTPQELRLFYENNRNLLPSIPRETSNHLRHLLLGLLQRNHMERMDFNEFFHHPFLETSPIKKSSPVPILSYRSSGSGSSSNSSSASHHASPQHSDGEIQRPQSKARHSPTHEPPGLLLEEAANQEIRNASSDIDDYVMVPAQFPSDITCEMADGSPIEGNLIYSGTSLLAENIVGTPGRTPPASSSPHNHPSPIIKVTDVSGSNYSQSVPIPVPTQIQNYNRMEQNLPASRQGSPRAVLPGAGSNGGGSPGCSKSRVPYQGLPTISPKTALPHQLSPPMGTTPKFAEQTAPISTRTGQLAGLPGMPQNTSGRPKSQRRNSTIPVSRTVKPLISGRRGTAPDLRAAVNELQTKIIRTPDNKNGPLKRSLSTGRLSDMLLKAAFGAQLLMRESDEFLYPEKSVDTTAPPGGYDRASGGLESPAPTIFTLGSPCRDNSPLDRMISGSPNYTGSARLLPGSSPRRVHKEADKEFMDVASGCCLVFQPPELPEDTLMEQTHTDALCDLRFTLAFVHCVMEIASSKDPGLEANESPDMSFLEQSLVADQISLLSKEWSHAQQLVLYMKAEEFLSSALYTAKEDIKEGRLIPSTTVKQVIRKLNDLYKMCVTFCRSLNGRLHGFLLDKQRLMDRFNGITAEKIIYSHTVHMVQAAALDEMFHRGQMSVQRYQKALLLMEGLSRVMTQQEDIDAIDKCKECIERRFSALQTLPFP